MSRRKGSTLTHGGKRARAGRPQLQTVKKMYKLESAVVERIKSIAEANGRTESSIANELLFRAVFTP